MNDPEPQLDDVIDQIVDGGLSPRELRSAVARLDASPDHWRRCALAFIEAQALGEVLRDMDEARPSSREVVPFRRKSTVVRRLAYAASLSAAAFGLGWMGHGATGKQPVLAHQEDLPGGTGRTHPVAIAREQNTGRALPVPPDEEILPGAGLPPPPQPPAEGLIAGEPTEVPFEDWLRSQPPPISSYEQAALEREGYRVEQRREIVLGTLDDGRLAALPVDEVQVEYVGHLPL